MLSLLRIPLIQRLYVLDRWSDAGIYLQDSKDAAPILYQITVLLNAYCERLKLWGGNSFNREGDPKAPAFGGTCRLAVRPPAWPSAARACWLLRSTLALVAGRGLAAEPGFTDGGSPGVPQPACRRCPSDGEGLCLKAQGRIAVAAPAYAPATVTPPSPAASASPGPASAPAQPSPAGAGPCRAAGPACGPGAA